MIKGARRDLRFRGFRTRILVYVSGWCFEFPDYRGLVHLRLAPSTACSTHQWFRLSDGYERWFRRHSLEFLFAGTFSPDCCDHVPCQGHIMDALIVCLRWGCVLRTGLVSELSVFVCLFVSLQVCGCVGTGMLQREGRAVQSRARAFRRVAWLTSFVSSAPSSRVVGLFLCLALR